MESNSVCNHTRRSDKQITRSSDLFITSMITDRIGRHEVLLPIHDDYNKICDVSGFLKSKHKKFREFFASREEKNHLSARMMARTVLLVLKSVQ